MKTTTTLAALFVCLIATASYGQTPDALVGVAPQLIQRPNVGPVLQQSNYLGLAIESHNQRGLKVFQTHRNGIAATAGLEKGDIVVGAEGYYVDTLSDLENAMRNSRGDSIEITVKDINTGRWVNVRMRHITRVSPNPPVVYIDEPIAEVGNPLAQLPSLGVSVEVLRTGGYKINTITPGSVAEKVNLTVGDTILKVNGTKIENLRNLDRTFKQSFTMVYDDAETGYRYTMQRTVWGG